jgi:ABC-type dipeptide/oligopeptide/nickel transport system ATPase component
LLVQSIPLPDPDRRWDTQEAAPITDVAEVGTVKVGCPFAPRCPALMDVCRSVAPRLFQVEDRVAACHLYGDNPVLPHADLMQSFALPTKILERISAD